jgi:putative serine protease PepD
LEEIMVRHVLSVALCLIFVAAMTAVFAQEPRHIEIRIINPSPVQKAESKDPAQDKAMPAPAPGPSAQPDDVSQIVRQSMPAVITVISGNKQGSGFFVSPDGLVLTNSHVIESQSAQIRFPDGKSVAAMLLRNDQTKDLALLKANTGSNYPTLPMGDSDKAVQGESVITIGSPIGLEGTVTMGIISAIRKAHTGVTYIQIDAAINQGNSGGPLLNKAGQVIGINTGKPSQPGTERLGFAISINDAKRFIAQ